MTKFAPIPVIVLDVLTNSIRDYDSFSEASRDMGIDGRTIRSAASSKTGWYKNKRIFKKTEFAEKLRTDKHLCWGMKNVHTGVCRAFTSLENMALVVGMNVQNLKKVLKDKRCPIVFGEVMVRPLDGYSIWRDIKPLEEELFAGCDSPVVRISLKNGSKTVFRNILQLSRSEKISYTRLRSMRANGEKEFSTINHRYVFAESN